MKARMDTNLTGTKLNDKSVYRRLQEQFKTALSTGTVVDRSLLILEIVS